MLIFNLPIMSRTENLSVFVWNKHYMCGSFASVIRGDNLSNKNCILKLTLLRFYLAVKENPLSRLE